MKADNPLLTYGDLPWQMENPNLPKGLNSKYDWSRRLKQFKRFDIKNPPVFYSAENYADRAMAKVDQTPYVAFWEDDHEYEPSVVVGADSDASAGNESDVEEDPRDKKDREDTNAKAHMKNKLISALNTKHDIRINNISKVTTTLMGTINNTASRAIPRGDTGSRARDWHAGSDSYQADKKSLNEFTRDYLKIPQGDRKAASDDLKYWAVPRVIRLWNSLDVPRKESTWNKSPSVKAFRNVIDVLKAHKTRDEIAKYGSNRKKIETNNNKKNIKKKTEKKKKSTN